MPSTMTLLFSILGTLTFAAAHAGPSARPAAAASITTLPAVTVTGVVVGPGLWKVTLGEHVLWVLGVPKTLPANVQWQSATVASTIAHSQAVLELPKLRFKLDTTWLGKLFLLPSALGAIHNPHGETLQNVLPAALYARWDQARQRYFGNQHRYARDRPMYAASKLRRKALKVNGLHGSGQITRQVYALAKQAGVAQVPTGATVEIHKPHRAIKTLARDAPVGAACMAMVLDTVEHRLPAVRAAANAWAMGDLQALRQLPQNRYREACRSVLSDPAFARALGIANLPGHERNAWLAAAESALANHAQTFALLPIDELLAPDGYLAALAARGFQVTAPDQNPPATASSATAAGRAH